MRLRWAALLLVFATMRGARAQEISAETPVNPALVQKWLESGDPRLIAWAATFARTTHDADAMAKMPELLVHWVPQPMYARGRAQAEQVRAMQAVLDALIESGAQVPVDAIRMVAEGFPAQASILAGRLPLRESHSLLNDWSYGRAGGWGEQTLGRVATMMLAKEPDAALVARVVAASEEELRVAVVDPGQGGVGGGFGRGCGDSMGLPPTPRWPQVYAYDLVEGDETGAGVVIELDGDRIVYRRFEDNRPLGSCNGVDPLNGVTRHRLIAHWLGVSPKAMAWQPVETVALVWTNRAAYERELGTMVAQHRERLRETTVALRQRGLLGAADARPEPRLVVSVQCEMTPCPLGTAR